VLSGSGYEKKIDQVLKRWLDDLDLQLAAVSVFLMPVNIPSFTELCRHFAWRAVPVF